MNSTTQILDMAQILHEADTLAEMIVNSTLALEYKESRTQLYNNKEVQSLIRDFQHKKEQYEEVQRFGRYHPDFQKVRKETFELKRTLDQHPIVARFKQAENDLQDLLIEISRMIASQVSPSVFVPDNNPFFIGKSCGTGGCGSGGACGCKQ